MIPCQHQFVFVTRFQCLRQGVFILKRELIVNLKFGTLPCITWYEMFIKLNETDLIINKQTHVFRQFSSVNQVKTRMNENFSC